VRSGLQRCVLRPGCGAPVGVRHPAADVPLRCL